MQVEEVISVSTKGQIVLPKKIRKKLGIEPGKKLLVATDNDSILLRKLEDVSLLEISERTGKIVESEGIDVASLVDEAIAWARKDKRSARKARSK